MTGDELGNRDSGCKSLKRGEQKRENRVVLVPVLEERIDELGKMVGLGGSREILAQISERLNRCRLSYHVELAPARENEMRVCEELQMAGHAACRPPNPSSDNPHLAEPGGEDGDDAISFRKIHALERNGLSCVHPSTGRGAHETRPSIKWTVITPASRSISWTTSLMAGSRI